MTTSLPSLPLPLHCSPLSERLEQAKSPPGERAPITVVKNFCRLGELSAKLVSSLDSIVWFP